MKKKLLLMLCVLIGIVGNSWAEDLERHSPGTKDFYIGTHYYGLAEYSWPVNYLNSIKNDSIEGELKRLKDLGFDTIILLASWSEFEPTFSYQLSLLNYFVRSSKRPHPTS